MGLIDAPRLLLVRQDIRDFFPQQDVVEIWRGLFRPEWNEDGASCIGTRLGCRAFGLRSMKWDIIHCGCVLTLCRVLCWWWDSCPHGG